jgi:hypothetical protein
VDIIYSACRTITLHSGFHRKRKCSALDVIQHTGKDVGWVFESIVAPKQLVLFYKLAAGRLFKATNLFIDFRWHFRIHSLR